MIPGAASVTTSRRRVTFRALAPPVTAALMAVSLSGCAYWAPDVTQVDYSAGVGLNAETPDVLVRNLVVVGADAEGPGVLSGVLLNRTGEPVDVQIRAGEGALDTTVTVPGDGRVLLTAPGQGDRLDPGAPATEAVTVAVVDPLGVPPGQTIAVGVITPAYGELVLRPPVAPPTSAFEGFLDQVPQASPATS
ncbi:MAG: hypothetical protein ACFCVF_05005 [Kineosporiaceae bacterium]